jgi:hypothetical protein
MKLKLEALSPAEGIGILRAGQTLRLVRPPYSLHESPVLAEKSLRDAILMYGYFASQEQFSSWEEVIDFLNRQAVESRRALGKEIPESIAGADILEVAPVEVLSAFLDRVERELIPRRVFDHAENFLLALLASSALTRHPAVGSRAAKLLQHTKEARECAEAAVSKLASRDVRFESLERHRMLEVCAELAEIIRARGSVFAPCS